MPAPPIFHSSSQFPTLSLVSHDRPIVVSRSVGFWIEPSSARSYTSPHHIDPGSNADLEVQELVVRQLPWKNNAKYCRHKVCAGLAAGQPA